MEGKLIKTPMGYYRLMVENFVDYDYGHTSPEYCELQNRDGSYTHKLSLKNCQAIERGYDLDELAYSNVPNGTYETSYIDLGLDIYKEGFQKALELMGDKTFSEEDLRLAMHFGRFGEANNQTTTIGFIQSLQQTEWDVTVEMEYVGECNGNNDEGCFQDSPGHNCGCFERRPKLDADGCLILKRIWKEN